MSDSSNSNKYYVPTPIAADYESANSDILNRASKFGVKTHRLLSAKGDRANKTDQGATNFRFLEDSLFSNKNVKLSKSSAPSMFDSDYIQKMRELGGCTYKVLRFDRSHNIRSFDFIITYSQLNSFGAESYKPVLLTKQYKGSLLFTGCSIVRDTDTMEELPLKLYGKYESIGDTINNALDLDANENAKGGPTLKVKYTFDNDYVYLFLESVSPFRLIPVGDGEFIDISYTEGRGSLIGESKENINVTSNPITGAKKTVSFSADNRIWCDVVLSLKDTTISHDVNNAEFIDYDDETMATLATNLREQEVIFAPTNDGEQIVIGMEPSSNVNLEIAPDIRPIRFGSDLLNTSKEKIVNYIEKLKNKIIDCGTNIEKVPFSIKTSIRTKGKYNINGEYFIDSQADGFGNIIINDVGIYDAITGTFDITEYIFDKNQTKYTKLDTVKNYKDYKDNASDYLTSISAVDETTGLKPKYKSVRKTNNLLDILTNIEFETPSELDVYFNVAFVKNTLGFTVLAAYAEFGEYEDENSDDYIIYVCADNKIRVVNFKDYDMEHVRTIDLTTRTQRFTEANKITKIDRSEVDGAYKYYLGTNNGLIIVLTEIINNPTVEVIGAFDKNFISTEEVTLISTDDLYVYVGGADGNVSIVTTRTDSIKYLPSNFKYNDPIVAAKTIDEDHIVFISKSEISSFSLVSNKWNYEGDTYRTGVMFDNPYTDIPRPNLDYIIDQNGWVDVPVVQKGNFVYALGMRYDRETGYVGVYKKLNILTGTVTVLPMPDEDLRVFKGKLCVDGQYIYCIGGTSVAHANDPLSTRFKTYVSVFDTISDTWVSYSSNSFEIDNGIILDESNGYFPIARKGKVYVVHPKTNQITLNENTNTYVINLRRIYKSYEITIFDPENTGIVNPTIQELPSEINSTFVNLDINVVPLIAVGGEIHFFSGHPDIIGNQFNGYNLEKYVFRPDNETIVLKTAKVGTEYELVHNYDEGRYSNAPSDLFGNISKYSEDNEAIVLLLERYCLYVYSAGDNNLYCETHAIWHDISDNSKFSYLPLISSGEYNAWKKYNKNNPSNINLIKNDNCIYFLGGTADRVPDVLSLDSMSLIPAPRHFERLKGEPESAVLANTDELLKVIPVEDNFRYNEMASVLVGNEVYLLAITAAEEHILMKYKLDDVAAKPELVNILDLSSEEYHNWKKVSMTYNPESNTIIIATVNGTSPGTLETVSGKFSATVYYINTNHVKNIVEDSTVFANSKIVFPISIPGKSSVVFAGNDGNCLKINLITGGMNSIEEFVNDYYIDKREIGEVSSIRFAKSVSYGNKVCFAFAQDSGVIVSEYNFNENKYKTLLTLPDSANYEYPDIFRRNNEIYVTKGINGSNIGIDVFCINNGEMKHALLGSPSSAIIAPMAVSKKGYLYVFGIGRNSDSILRVLKSKIEDNTFINYVAIVDINSSDKSEYNRYNPNYTTIKLNGHELLLVFGGTQSLSVPTTTTIDIFDVNKHMWAQPVVLPTKLSHITVVENEIIGATEEITANAGKVAYPKKLTLTCQNYDSLRFEITEEAYPAINGLEYPIFAKYALDKTNNIVYIIDTLENGCIRNKVSERAIYKVDLTHGSFSKLNNLPEIVYSETTYVIGLLVAGNSLIVATYSFTTNSVSVFSYNENIGTWNELKRISLSFTPTKNPENDRTIIANLSVFSTHFNAIKNDTLQADSTKAIISILNEYNVYGIYISYKNTVTISNAVKVHELPKDSIIDRCYISSEGFVYASDRFNNKTYRCYPNNDEAGFGITNIDIIDTHENPIARCIRNNAVYAIYNNGDVSVILGSSVRHDYACSLENVGTVVKGSITNYEDKVIGYFFNENNELFKVVFDDLLEPIWSKCELFQPEIGLENLVVEDICVNSSNALIVANNTIYLVGDDGTISDSVSLETGLIHKAIYAGESLLTLGFDRDNKKFVALYSNDSEIDRITLPFNYDEGKWFIVDTNVYHIDLKGKVYLIQLDAIAGKFTSARYVAKTDYRSNIANKILVFNGSNIFDMDRGVVFAMAYTIDNDHYCFNESAINYNNDKIVTIIKAIDEEYYICVHDFATHKLLNKHIISDEFVGNSTVTKSFVCKSGNVLKYCSVFDGKIQIIDASNGNVTVVANNKLVEGKIINFLPSKNKYIVGNDTTSYLVFDPHLSEISEIALDYLNYENFELKQVLYANRYAEFIYGFFTNTINGFSYLGKIYKDNKVIQLTYSNINDEVSTLEKTNDGFLANINDRVYYLFTIDEFESKCVLKKVSPLEYYNKRVVDNNALLDFDSLVREKTGLYVASNGYVVKEDIVIRHGLFTDHSLKFREFENYVVIYGPREDDNTLYKLIFINTVTGKEVIVNTDVAFDKFEIADIRPLYDSVIEGGITRIGHIVGIVNNEIRSYSIKISDPNGDIKDYSDYEGNDSGISLVANDENTEHVSVSRYATIVNLQNRFIGVLDNEKLYTFTLSAAWRLISAEIDLPAGVEGNMMDNEFYVFVVGDIIYYCNPHNRKTIAVCLPYEGSLVNITDGYNLKEIYFDDKFYDNISYIGSGEAHVADNTKVCNKRGRFGVYLNTLSNCAEYYNRFIGVDGSGEVIDNIVPISEYDISFITVSDETNQSTLRSNENVKTVIRMIYKSSNKNIVSEISSISRLNTDRFRVLYSKTNDDEIGDIYAFLDTENNGTLVRDDTSYYRGDYSVVVVNNNIIKINIDGEIYTYSRADNEIPLYNQILPIIIVYGERENDSGNTEPRYLSFVDIKGNLVTYDKEIKSFIDISGYVDVEIPFFSTEAMIYPSKSNLFTANDALVEKSVNSTK